MNQTYEELTILPRVIAETVATQSQVYRNRFDDIPVTLTQEQIAEFVNIADQWCRAAHNSNAKWWIRIINSKTNRGRDQLCVFMRHWLDAYVRNPEKLRSNIDESCGTLPDKKES